jgi:hypothetical protein
MSNATKNLIRRPYGKDGRDIHLPVDGGSHIYEGTLVSQLSATAMLVPGSTASSGPAVGVSTHEVDNTGSDGAKRCVVETDRIFEFTNGSGGDACSEATKLFSVVYMGDDHTIFDNDAGGTLQAAGRFCGMSEDGKVRVFVGMANLGDALADAEDVAIADTGSFTSQTDVEGALAEIYQHLKTANAHVLFSLHELREVDANGDVGNAAANGGLLASDTTPILRATATTEYEEVSWAATNVDPVQLQTALPSDFDGTGSVTLDLWVYTDNAGGGGIDAATFTVETSWDGGSLVSDTATDGSPATSIHKITATIDAADVPDAASFVTIKLIPAAHGNDPTQLVAARLNYTRKLLTS